jgi:hypothetical protein
MSGKIAVLVRTAVIEACPAGNSQWRTKPGMATRGGRISLAVLQALIAGGGATRLGI